ncbi:Glucagon-like peptide 2 receptor, partial [Nibea albiflora]
QVTGSELESLIAQRTEYSEKCNRTLGTLSETGIYCKGTFDMFVCWPHSAPGNVSVPCPSYLPWISEDDSRRAHRECLENGRWRRMKNSSDPWRDDSECKEAHFYKDKIVFMCKFSKVCMQYFVACNYFWLLVEAIFLHTLLFTAVLTKRRLLKKYMLLGWGTPVLFVTPWTVVKILYENIECWSIMNRWIWWIIRGPITLSVLVIFFIFIKILMLLLSKLKADQVKFTDYRYSLARATLVLIPLLGIHEVVFTVLVDECVDNNSRYAKNFINLTLSSFQ